MLSNIKDFSQKIKFFAIESKSELLSVIIIIVVGFSSYGLGFLAGLDTKKEGVDQSIVRTRQSSSVILSDSVSDKKVDLDKLQNNEISKEDTQTQAEIVVASKSGNKYHYPWCSGAKQIAEKNKITFDSIEDARKAGYTPASNCKGLK